jgi:hypothetical protein
MAGAADVVVDDKDEDVAGRLEGIAELPDDIATRGIRVSKS